jgi:hypothetical protein
MLKFDIFVTEICFEIEDVLKLILKYLIFSTKLGFRGPFMAEKIQHTIVD